MGGGGAHTFLAWFARTAEFMICANHENLAGWGRLRALVFRTPTNYNLLFQYRHRGIYRLLKFPTAYYNKQAKERKKVTQIFARILPEFRLFFFFFFFFFWGGRGAQCLHPPPPPPVPVSYAYGKPNVGVVSEIDISSKLFIE